MVRKDITTCPKTITTRPSGHLSALHPGLDSQEAAAFPAAVPGRIEVFAASAECSPALVFGRIDSAVLCRGNRSMPALIPRAFLTEPAFPEWGDPGFS
jgi:hypothetical protein